MTDLEILIAARAKLAQGWCQGWYALDATDDEVPADSPTACKWCMIGALKAVIPGEPQGELRAFLGETLFSLYSVRFVPEFNDAPERTQEQCLFVYDAAIHRKRSAA